MYSAIILDPNDAHFLKEKVQNLIETVLKNFQFSTPDGQILPHHCTINLGELNEKLNPPEILNKRAHISIDSILYNEEIGVCAANVSECETECGIPIQVQSGFPHITCCLKENVAPKNSLKLYSIHHSKIDFDMKLTGIIEIVKVKKP